MNTFSGKLKNLREEFGMTQTDLSKKLEKFSIKTSAQNISYWEKGRQPPFNAVIALSNIFNVSIDYLLGATPYKTREEELELSNITKSSDEILDQRIVNSLINLKKILCILKEGNSDYFEDYIRFLSISKEYFLEMNALSLDIQLQILELKEINIETIKILMEDNNYRLRNLDDIYFHLNNFLSSISMDYKSNLISNAINQLLKSKHNFYSGNKESK